jgi:small subunit ribosomal protein S3
LGHKVHPLGFRLGIIKDWQSKWYSESHYAEFVLEDNKLREYIRAKYPEAAISLIEIDRQAKDVTITLHTARPGIVIGRGGQRVDEMRQHLEALIGKKLRLNIQEIRQPEMDAYLVARSIAEQIERRVAYRLGNAEIARRQTSHQGQVPLHTLRADIDYGFTEARTTLGRIGVKVWIYKGQILPELKAPEVEEKPAEAVAEAEAAVAKAPAAEARPVEAPPAAEKVAAAAEKAPAAAEEKPARPKVKKAVKAAPEAVEAAAKVEAEKPAPKKVARAAAPEAVPAPEKAAEKPAPKKAARAAAPEAVPAPEKAAEKPAPKKAARAAAPAAAAPEKLAPAREKAKPAAEKAAPAHKKPAPAAAKAEEKPAPKRARKAPVATEEEEKDAAA